jgi:hypothetical protein
MFQKKTMTRIAVFFMVLVLGAVWGCQKKGEEVPLEAPGSSMSEEVPMPAVPSKIMVPEEVTAKWKAVVLEVTDKESGERTDYTVNVGENSPLGDTGLNVFVEAFLPAFQMAGDVFTSSSADLTNPAAKVEIKDEGGTLLFNRWLFAMYPATHPFEHPKYAVILKDYVAGQ